MPFSQFPSELKNEVVLLKKWKSAEYAMGRPKGGRHREVSSKALEDAFCILLGFVVNILGEPAPATLSELVQEKRGSLGSLIGLLVHILSDARAGITEKLLDDLDVFTGLAEM